MTAETTSPSRSSTELVALVAQMTTAEKVALTAGVDFWHTTRIGRLGLEPLKVSDGPVGARGSEFSGGPASACMPCGTALAATWDTDLVREVGAALGQETAAKGAHILLAPTVNLHRHPLAGRNFECYSEDPYLTARMAVAAIKGIQSEGVGACIKHFVANDSEFERMTMSSEVPERALRELYLHPFERAVAEARPLAVMSAYNKLYGTWCSENPELLTTILRDEWEFDGLVVSDWFGTHDGVASLRAGLDLEMPGPARARGEHLLAAVERGEVPGALLDAAVTRLLATMERCGAGRTPPAEERVGGSPEVDDVALRAATSAIVLLRNEPVDGRPVLPLDVANLRSLAVIGPLADRLAIMGGGSAAVSPARATSILEGLEARLEGLGMDVRYEPGCSIDRFPPALDLRHTVASTGGPGVEVTYVRGTDPDSDDVVSEIVLGRPAFSWTTSGPCDGPWSARGGCVLQPVADGVHKLQAIVTGRARVWVDDQLVIDAWDTDRPRRTDGTVELVAGGSAELRFHYAPPDDLQAGSLTRSFFEIGLQPPVEDDAMARAVALASSCDAAVVVIGTSSDWETEGRDRRDLSLPGPQAELVRAVAAANPRTAVVVNAGAPVDLSWRHQAAAVLQSWFLGQATGDAVAAVLCGDEDASGRLPTTLPERLEDTPAYTSYPGEHGRVHYGEGLFVGYRWYEARDIAPAYPFGHGLSYTTFSYSDLSVDASSGGDVDVAVTVTNTGERAGCEVVQVYVGPQARRPHDPLKQLRAFKKVMVTAGESERVELRVNAQDLAAWDPSAHDWDPARGTYVVSVGSSSNAIRASAEVAL